MNFSVDLQPETKIYQEKLNTLTSTFLSALDDFKKYYVFTFKNPEVDEYQNFFLNSKSQLQNINKEVILVSNDIKKDIEKINFIVNKINIQLGNEKELNGEMLNLFNNLQNSNNGSSLLLEETTNIYNKQYLYNCEIALGIFILFILILISYKTTRV